MFFIIQNKYNWPAIKLKFKIIIAARRAIALYNLNADDLIVDNYLRANYKTSLKVACLTILGDIMLLEDKDGQVVVKFRQKKYDKLARLITYGDGSFSGSKILQTAFNQM